MKTIMVLLISVVLAVPWIAMGTDYYPSLCLNYGNYYGISDLNGRIIVEPERAIWDPSETSAMEPVWSGKIGVGTTVPYADIEVQMDSPALEKAKVIAFQWADERKCFDFAWLREYKQFKEITCQ